MLYRIVRILRLHTALPIWIGLIVIVAWCGGCGLVWEGTLALTSALRTPEDLELVPKALPDGRVGEPYHAALQITEPGFAVTPYAEVIEGEIPSGLSVSISGAQVEGRIVKPYSLVFDGVPQEAGTYTFSVSVSCCGTMAGHTEGRARLIFTVADVAATNVL